MILDEARIHKYTHTNHKLNALNIKYYNFCFKFQYNRILQRKVTRRCRSDTEKPSGMFLGLIVMSH
jgi:hypothetical protein